MTPSTAAVCPNHPSSPSVAICERCGRFVCQACLASETPALCSTCAPLLNDPLGVLSAPFGFRSSVRHGMRMLGLVWPKVLIVTALFSVPGGLVSHLNAPSDEGSLSETARNVRVSNFYDAVVGLVGVVAVMALLIGAAEGRRLSLGQALREALGRYGRVFVARLRSGLWTLLFLLLLVVPGIWKGILLAFSTEAAVRIERMDPLELSTALVRPRWWPVFWVVTGTAAIFLMPTIIGVAVFDALARLTPAPPLLLEIIEDWASRLAEACTTACTLAAFYGLCRSNGVSLQPMRWVTQPREP